MEHLAQGWLPTSGLVQEVCTSACRPLPSLASLLPIAVRWSSHLVAVSLLPSVVPSAFALKPVLCSACSGH
jgi:hypothetical protein